MSIARASAIMISTLVASRVLGWLRLSVIGARFGESPELDAFWAAFKIPDAIFGLLVAGALAPAFIPVFARYLARPREGEARRVASSRLHPLPVAVPRHPRGRHRRRRGRSLHVARAAARAHVPAHALLPVSRPGASGRPRRAAPRRAAHDRARRGADRLFRRHRPRVRD